jgi:hypothetical protein
VTTETVDIGDDIERFRILRGDYLGGDALEAMLLRRD